jgi:hypothetical protein
MNAHTFPSLHHDNKRQLHHLSAPLETMNYHQQHKQSLQGSGLSRLHGFPSSEDVAQLGDPTPTNTDDDGDEEMQDATETKSDAAQASYQALTSRTPAITGNNAMSSNHGDSNDQDHKSRVQSQSLGHCAGQPNLLISRQRIAQSLQSSHNTPPPRPFAGPTRTKSSSHLRTTSADIRSVMPPLPGAASLESETSSKRKGNSPYSSVGRRAGKTMSSGNHNQQHGTSFIELGLDNEADISIVSISSLLRRSHPVAPSASPNNTLGSADKNTSSSPGPQPLKSSTANLLPPKSFLATPPSAPPTKTTFGFLPSHGSLGDGLINSNRRARHARSSSARSVREMIREREGLGPLTSSNLGANLHSFHPLGKPESTGSRKRLLGNHNTSSGAGMSVSEESEGENSQNADVKVSAQRKTNLVLPNLTGSTLLPLDDPSRSFAHRRKNTRRLGASGSDTNENGGSSRSSPPPPLMLLPTLPLNFNIKALVPPSTDNGSGGEEKSGGYVSRREPHSPDPRNSQWRTRRSTPPGVAGAAATRCGVVS